MVGMYEPYVEVCRRLAELSPCAGENQKSLLLNSGAEAVENAVKIARAATGRPGVVVFDNAFHGRTLLTMTMTHKEIVQAGLRPVRAGGLSRARPLPVPRRVLGRLARSPRRAARRGTRSPASCSSRSRARAASSTCPPTSRGRLAELCREHGVLYVDDEVQSGIGRTGPVWAIEHYETEPDLLVSGKSLGGGLPLAAVTGRAEVMDAPHPGGLGGTFGGNPVACAAALAVLDEVATDEFRARAESSPPRSAPSSSELASRVDQVGDVRGIGAMLALELVTDRESKEPAADLAKRTTEAARERGLILLSCGTLGNVIRILVPLVISDDDLARGLEILEESLVDAATG